MDKTKLERDGLTYYLCYKQTEVQEIPYVQSLEYCNERLCKTYTTCKTYRAMLDDLVIDRMKELIE